MSTREPEETKDAEAGREPEARRVAERPDPPDLRRDPDELRREIDDLRGEVGDTVEALAEKTDVRAQVSEKLGRRREAFRDRRDGAKQTATQLRGRVAAATPEDAKNAASRVAHAAETRPLPAIGVAVALGFVLGRLSGRR